MKRGTAARTLKRTLPMMLGVLLLCFATGWAATNDKAKNDNRPEREIAIAFEYPEVIVDGKDELSLNLAVKNKGKRDENIFLNADSAPSGWTVKFKTFNFTITSLHVPGGEKKDVIFNAVPPKGVKPGEYAFTVNARTEDGKFVVSHSLKVTLVEKKKEKGEILLNIAYPVLRGANDAKFAFSLDMVNKSGKEDTFNIITNPPKDWQVNVKPSYEEKYITSLRLKADESKSINLEVAPDRAAKAGEYSIPVMISTGSAKAEINLKVVITGTFKLEAGTPKGILSLETEKGKTGNISVYVKNVGTAAIRNIELLSVKPENWKVEFKPERIEALEPGALKQIEVSITPAQEALVGDYAVALNINGEKIQRDLELRVTVKASAAWGWVGIGIIALVIAGLFMLFVTFGRR